VNKNLNLIIGVCFLLIFISCTFDYGETGDEERELPDLVMENVEYIRVRSSDPIAKFQAERAERYERQGLMKLENFSFEQYGERGEEINALGRAGSASIEIESGDIFMDNGIWLEVESEDIIIETKQLEWRDEPKIMTSGEDEDVHIYQENGTHFTGIGLRVETRSRLWEFSGAVGGIYVFVETEEEEEEEIIVFNEDIDFYIEEINENN